MQPKTRIAMKGYIYLLILFIPAIARTQTIKGVIRDDISQMGLIGATIRIQDSSLGTSTDPDGRFVLDNCPAGRYVLEASYLGYKAEMVEVLVITGQETIIDIGLEEDQQTLKAVEVIGLKKTSTVNKLAKVSARVLSMSTVTRYSAGRGDLARMASNFAGVAMQGDEANALIIRGNTPNGVQWRLEGVPVNNPNHFALLGNSSGSISAINPNTLAQSDFFAGAFPAEYGNALAGVIDVRLRTGNKDKHERLFQIGAWSGVEALVEGPMIQKWEGSYLIAYRYSFSSLLEKAGLNPSGVPVPDYQDLSFNLDFRRHKHRFNIYGLWGVSDVAYTKTANTQEAFSRPVNEAVRFNSALGNIGIKHQYLIDSVSHLRTVVAVGHNSLQGERGITMESGDLFLMFEDENIQQILSVSSQYNRKFGTRTNLRAGLLSQMFQTDNFLQARPPASDSWRLFRDFDQSTWLHEAYVQMQYKVKKRYSFNIGLHSQYAPFILKTVVEPRLAFKLKLPAGNDLVFAYGLHSQLPFLPLLYITDTGGNFLNAGLDFIRNHHFVLGWDKKLGNSWRLHAEAYYQWLSRVPVTPEPSVFSALNTGVNNNARPVGGVLVSTGNGKNCGLEATLSRSLAGGFYTMINASVFQARYRGSDLIWRNTAFNAGYIANALLGKEFPVKNKSLTFTFDTKLSTMGGLFYTPIDLAASIAQGVEVPEDSKAFQTRYPAMFQWDVRVGLRKNNRRTTHVFYLDLSNVTNRKNIAYYYFQPGQNTIFTQFNNIGIGPDIVWRVHF